MPFSFSSHFPSGPESCLLDITAELDPEICINQLIKLLQESLNDASETREGIDTYLLDNSSLLLISFLI